jgi:hypothetical protein
LLYCVANDDFILLKVHYLLKQIKPASQKVAL